MLTFKNITVRDAAMLRRYYENCDYALCEYSAGVKLMWRSALRYAWAEAAGCLIIRCESEGRVSFDYPVAGPDGDEDAALSAIEAYCMETGIQPEISIVPEEKAPVLLSRYPYVRVSNIRTWRDYLYYKEDLQLFAGRRYSGQRNHIKKFYAQWPNAEFRPISAKADAGAIEQFWVDFKAEFPKDSGSKAMAELELSKKMMAFPDKHWLLRGGMFDVEKLIALSLCEKCGETLIIHIEKALYSYAGAYPAMVQAEVAAFGDGCTYVNREDDAGDRGLRTSKLQYGPAKLAPKYHFLPQNELLRHVSAIPELKTERLKNSAAEVGSTILDGIGSMIGTSKVKRQELEIGVLRQEVAARDETIEILQKKIQTMQAEHNRELTIMQARHAAETTNLTKLHEKEVSLLKAVLSKAVKWFPYFREMIRMESVCRTVGFDDEQTAMLIKGKPLEYSGKLYSEEHNCKFTVERVTAQITPDLTDKRKLQLTISKIPVKEWCREKFEKARHFFSQEPRQSKGFKR